MKSKKLSLLLIILMTALIWETALRAPSRSAESAILTDEALNASLADGDNRTAPAGDVSDVASEDFHGSIPVTFMPATSHTYLTSPAYVSDTQTGNVARLLSAPLSAASKAVRLGDSNTLFPKTFRLDVQYLPQNPELPTGCESVALTTVLNYLGYPVTKFEIVDEYLPTGDPGKVDPDYAFPGNPYSQGGFGCFAPAIVQTANDYFADHDYTEDTAVDVSGHSVPELCIDYLYKYKRPVVFWASINMVHLWTAFEWTIDGKKVPWRYNEHCLALIGWTEKTYIFSDPLRGIVEYEKNLVEEVYKENMKNAVFIMPSRSYLRTCADRPETSSPE